jgi:hypothetical protein
MAKQCSLKVERLLNVVGNKGAFRDALPKDPTFEEMIEYVDGIHDNLELDSALGKYRIKNVVLEKRPSQLSSEVYTKKGGVDRLTLNDGLLQTDAGTQLHFAAAAIGEAYYKFRKNGGTGSFAFNYSKLSREINQVSSVQIPIDIIEHMGEVAMSLVDTAFDTQENIDSTKMPEIRFELKMMNPIKDIGGTGDMVVFYSDRSASYFDYKTFEPGNDTKEYNTDLNKFVVTDPQAYKSYRREKWELSVPAYIDMLKSVYKVTSIRHQRAIPIATFFEKTAEYQTAAKSKDRLRMDRLFREGKTRAPKLRQVASFVDKDQELPPAVIGLEDIKDGNLSKFLQERFIEVEELRSIYEQTKAGVEKERLRNKILDVKTTIDKVLALNDTTAIIEHAHKIVLEAKQLIKDLSNPVARAERWQEMQRLRKELNYYSDLANLTSEYLDKLPNKTKREQKEIKKWYAKLGQTVTELANYSGQLNVLLIEEMKHRGLIADDITDEEINMRTVIYEEDDTLQHYFKGAGQSNNPFFRKMKELEEKINRQDRVRMNKLVENTEKHFALLEEYKKERGWSDRDFIDFIIAPNTGNLVAKFDPRVYEITKKAQQDGDSAFFINNFDVKDNYQASYERRLQLQKERIATKINPEKDAAKYKDAVMSWIQENALYIDGVINETAWTKDFNIKYFLKRKAAFESQYYSDKYKYISGQPKLKAWYDFWIQTMFEAKDLLGHTDGVYSNLVPWIKKETYELAIGRKGNVFTEVLDSLSVAHDGAVEYYDAFGNPEKSIPLYYTQPFKDKDGKLDIGAKSMNLQRSLLLFMQMAYNYDSKSKHEASVMAIRDMMSEMGAKYQRTKHGQIIRDNGIPKFERDSNQKALEDFDAYVNFYWYGQRLSSKDKTVEAFGREISLNRGALMAKRLYGKKALAWNLHAPIANYFVGVIGGRVTAQKGMLYNPSQYNSATASWAASKITTFTGANEEGKKFKAFINFFDPHNDTNLNKKLHSISTSKLDKWFGDRSQFNFFMWSDEGVMDTVAVAIAKNYVIENGILRHPSNASKSAKTLYELFSFKEVNGKVEMELQGLTEEQVDNIWIAYRNIVREANRSILGNASDEEISLASTQLLGSLMLQFRTWLPNIAHEMFKGLKYDNTYDTVDVGRFTALADSYKGLTPKSGIGEHLKLMLNTSAKLFIEVMGMGRWLINDDERMLIDQMRSKEVYNTWVEKHPKLAKNVTYEQYLQARRRQIAALVANIRVLALLTMMYMVAAADWDDDDEKDYRSTFLTRHGFRLLNRVYTEAASMYNPQEFSKLVTGGPIPAWGLLVGNTKILINGLDSVRDSVIGQNSKNDQTPFFYYTGEMIPIVNQTRRIFELTPQDLRSVR